MLQELLPHDGTCRLLDETDRLTLQAAARGMTTRDIARSTGRSERTTYRDLRRLMNMFHVRNRQQIVRVAARLGLLE